MTTKPTRSLSSWAGAWSCFVIGACASAAAGGERDANADALPFGALARLGSTFLRHPGTVNAVAVSPDGQRVASAGSDGSVCVWDVATGARLFDFRTDSDPSSVAFGPDGNSLSCVSTQGRVTVLALEGSRQPRTFPLARGGMLARVSRNGAIAVAGGPGGAAVSRLSDGNDLGTVELAGQLTHLLVSPQGDFFVTLSFNPAGGGFLLRRSDVPSLKARWETKNRMVTMPAAVSSDGRLLAVASYDGNVFFLDANTGAQRSAVPIGHRYLQCLEFLPGGRLVGVTEEGICIWDAHSGKRLARFDSIGTGFAGLAVSADGQLLATAGPWHMVGLWNTQTGQPLFETGGHFGPVTGVAFASGDAQIISISADGRVRRWEVADGNDSPVMNLRDAQSHWLAVSPGGKRAASRSYAQRAAITLWDLEKARPLWTLDPGETAVSAAFSPDGQYLATGGYRSFRIWHVASGRLIRQIDTGSPPAYRMNTALAFSADNRIIAAGGNDGVRLYEAATGLEAAALAVPGGQGKSLAVSPDGRVLLAAAQDLCVFDLVAEGQPTTLPAGQDAVMSVAFSPDGRKIATGGSDGAILLWNAPRAAPVARSQPADGNELAGLWDSLASEDAPKAYQAAQRLIRKGPAAAAFLKDRLRPLVPATQSVDANKLLADLDRDSYRAREEASRKLAELGDARRLQDALEAAKSDEVRARLLELLADLADPLIPDRQELRRARAIRVLELIGGDAACEVLSRLARGGPGRLTRDADAALARLRSAVTSARPANRP